MGVAAELFRALTDVPQAHAVLHDVGFVAGAVVGHGEREPVAGTVEFHVHARGARVPRHVRQGLLRGPEERQVHAGLKRVVRRQRSNLADNLRAGTQPQGFALLLQRSDETDILERCCAKLIEHGVHLGHRIACRVPNLRDGVSRASGIGGESRFHGGGRRLNREQLLLHRVVEIAGQAMAFLLGSRLPHLQLVLRAQHVRWRCWLVAEQAQVSAKRLNVAALSGPAEEEPRPRHQHAREHQPDLA